MSKILIDSGLLIALFDRSDKYHLASVGFIKKNTSELITTIASITETLHLLDFSRDAQADFLSWINAGAVTIENLTSDDFGRIKELTIKHSNLPMDFEYVSLVFLGEKLSINSIATIDRNIDVYPIKAKKKF